MFTILKIYNDKETLYQYDADIFMSCEDFSGLPEYAHFVNTAKPTEVLSMLIEDGQVQIPNQCLTEAGELWVYAYTQDRTIVRDVFKIVPRPMPPEYILDPTPVITYPELVELVADLQAFSGDVEDIKNDINALDEDKMNKNNPEGSGTFKFGTNVEAISPSSIAQGDNTKAGGKAFTITAIGGADISRIITLDSVEGLERGMACSAYMKDIDDAHTDNFDNFGVIGNITGNVVTFNGGFVWNWDLDSEQSSHLWVIGRPDLGTKIIGDFAIAIGRDNIAQNEQSFASGRENVASGKYAVATGRQNKAIGYSSRVDGRGNTATGKYSVASGRNNNASAIYANASGYKSVASGIGSHAQNSSTAVGQYASSEGLGSIAASAYSHSEGYQTVTAGAAAHAEGSQTEANHEAAHVEGLKTLSGRAYQHVAGKYNIINGNAARVTGWGTSSNRKNIEILDINGNYYLRGDIYVKCADDGTDGIKLAKITDIPTVTTKYQHNISVIDTTSPESRIFFSYVNDDPTPHTSMSTIASALSDLGFIFDSFIFCPASGYRQGIGIYGVTNNYGQLYFIGSTNLTNQTTGSLNSADRYIHDTVVEL